MFLRLFVEQERTHYWYSPLDEKVDVDELWRIVAFSIFNVVSRWPSVKLAVQVNSPWKCYARKTVVDVRPQAIHMSSCELIKSSD